MSKVILSVDCGTQSLRVILFNTKGDILEIEKINYQPYVSPKPGWAEKDANDYWQSLCTACKRIKERNLEIFEQVAGVGITTLRSTMINVDKDGNPLRPAIVWLDQRKSDKAYTFSSPFRSIFKLLNVDEIIHKMQHQGKSNWIKQNQPDIWIKTHKFLQVSGYLSCKLTGEFKDSIASQIGHIPFDYKKQEWSTKPKLLDFAAKIFPIEREKLPDLVPPGGKLGEITEEASKATGLKAGIPVIACGSDKGCETLGMGILDKSMASLSFGTTASIQTTTSKYVEPQKFMPAYPALIPNHFNPEIEIFRGYWMITWFKNEFAYKEVEEAKAKNISAEVVLNCLLAKSPPGAMGLMVQPYWSPGVHEPEAKGAIIGFGDVHKKEHVYRAVIEGLAFGLLDGKYKLEKNAKTKFKKIAVSGGASQSDEICQITADIFNLELVRGKTWETSGLGAAIITAYGIGEYDSLDKAVKTMVSYSDTFKPNDENVAIYNQLFHKVYKRMYPSLKSIYKSIREITGYPE